MKKTTEAAQPKKHLVSGYCELKQALEDRGLPSFKESLLRSFKNNGKIPSYNVTPKTILFDVDKVIDALLQGNDTK